MTRLSIVHHSPAHISRVHRAQHSVKIVVRVTYDAIESVNEALDPDCHRTPGFVGPRYTETEAATFLTKQLDTKR